METGMRTRLFARMRVFFFKVFLFAFLAGFTQEAVITGIVKVNGSDSPLADVNIRDKKSGRSTVSGKDGTFVIRLPYGAAELRFSHVGYVHRDVSLKVDRDSIHITVKLNPDINEMEPVDISATRKPDTVIGSQRFFIEDFEFYEDKLVLLTFAKKPQKSRVMLAKEGLGVISVFEVPVHGLELYKDFLGNINVIGPDSVYRVIVEKEKIRLAYLDKEEFDLSVRRCVDTLYGRIIFSDYRPDYPSFSYYFYDRADSTVEEICKVVDEHLADLHAFEYYFLKPRDKLYARKMEMATGIDKKDIAALMTGFGKSRFFTPLHAPLYLIDDTLYLFEHYKDFLFRYDRIGHLIDSLPIHHHKPVKWKEWKRKLIREEGSRNIYGLFLKDGYYELKLIDISSGKILSHTRLTFPWVHKIRIRDGHAYYIYRPFESLQTKYLYKEKLESPGVR